MAPKKRTPTLGPEKLPKPEQKDEDPINSILFTLCRQDEFKKAEDKLRSFPVPEGVNAREPTFGWTLMHYAAHSGMPAFVNTVLEKNGRIDVVCEQGNNMVSIAARGGHAEAIELLISRKAEIDCRNKEHGFTPLIWAGSYGHVKATESLLEASADFHAVDYQGRSAVMWAARHGHLDMVNFFLRRYPDLSQRDHEGLTALDHAREHLELRAAMVMAEELKRRMLDASQRDDYDEVSLALENSCHPDVKDEFGWTPLCWAAMNDSVELARLLVRHGASPELLGENSELGRQLEAKHRSVGHALVAVLTASTDLLTAAEADDLLGVKQALENGACPDARQGCDGGGGGLATRGDEGDDVDLAEREAETMAGADAAADIGEEPKGLGFQRKMTALMWLAKHGSVEGVNLLGQAGANMDVRDARGWAAILYGVISFSAETISMLHYFKADINTRGFEGESALDMAVRVDSGTIIQLLLAAQGDIEQPNLDGRQPLHAAAHYGSVGAMLVLMYFKADASAQDSSGRTPLMVAAASGHVEVCEAMLAARLEDPPELPVEIPDSDVEEAVEQLLEVDELLEQNDAAGSRWKGGIRVPDLLAARRNSKDPSGAGSRKGSKEAAAKAPDSRKASKHSVVPEDAKAVDSEKTRLPSKARPSSGTSAKPEGTPRPGSPDKDMSPSSATRKLSKPPSSKKEDSSRQDSKMLASKKRVAGRSSRGSSKARSAGSDLIEREVEPEEEVVTEEKPCGIELLWAAAMRRKEFMKQAMEAPGPVLLREQGLDGSTALHCAMEVKEAPRRLDMLLMLLRLQANINAKDNLEVTPLMLAGRAGDLQAVEILLRAEGADVNAKDDEGRTAADHAAGPASLLARRRLEKAMALSNVRGANMRPSMRQTPLPEVEDTGRALFRVRLENLPLRMLTEELEIKVMQALKKLGLPKPVNCEVVQDVLMGRPKGIAYVDFYDVRLADKAMELNGLDLAGKTIKTFRDLPAAVAMVR